MAIRRQLIVVLIALSQLISAQKLFPGAWEPAITPAADLQRAVAPSVIGYLTGGGSRESKSLCTDFQFLAHIQHYRSTGIMSFCKHVVQLSRIWQVLCDNCRELRNGSCLHEGVCCSRDHCGRYMVMNTLKFVPVQMKLTVSSTAATAAYCIVDYVLNDPSDTNTVSWIGCDASRAPSTLFRTPAVATPTPSPTPTPTPTPIVTPTPSLSATPAAPTAQVTGGPQGLIGYVNVYGTCKY